MCRGGERGNNDGIATVSFQLPTTMLTGEDTFDVQSIEACCVSYIAATVQGGEAAHTLRTGIAVGAANARSPCGAVFDIDEQRRLLEAVSLNERALPAAP